MTRTIVRILILTAAFNYADESYAEDPSLEASLTKILKEQQGPGIELVGFFSEKSQETSFTPNNDSFRAYESSTISDSRSAAVFEFANETFILTPKGVFRIDLKNVNTSQWEAMKDALKRNKRDSLGTSYFLDSQGNIVGPEKIKIIQAISELKISPDRDDKYLTYNLPSDDIKKDFDASHRELVAREQLEAFQREVSALLEKYPRVAIIETGIKEPGDGKTSFQLETGAQNGKTEELPVSGAADFFQRP